MSNFSRTIHSVHARAALVLALGAIGVLSGRPALARGTDLGRYEAIVGAAAPQLPGPARDCDGQIAFGAGDGRCGSASGGPSGGDNSRN